MLPVGFVYLGVALQFLGSLKYISQTIQGKVQPNRVSWLLWAIAPMIGFFAMLQKGGGAEIWTTFIVGFVPLTILIASFFNRKPSWGEISKLDYICGGLSLTGLILWLVTGEGLLAIIFSILSDFFASIPTIMKSYKNPETEEPTLFLAGIINAGIGLLVITDWTFARYAFPLHLLLNNSIIWALNEPRVRKLFINKQK